MGTAPTGNLCASQHTSLLSKIFSVDQQHGYYTRTRALVADIIKVEGLLGKIAKRKHSFSCMQTIVSMVKNNEMTSAESNNVRAELAKAINGFQERGKRGKHGSRQGMQLDVVQDMLTCLDA